MADGLDRYCINVLLASRATAQHQDEHGVLSVVINVLVVAAVAGAYGSAGSLTFHSYIQKSVSCAMGGPPSARRESKFVQGVMSGQPDPATPSSCRGHKRHAYTRDPSELRRSITPCCEPMRPHGLG